MALLEATGICKSYPGQEVLKDLALQAEAGETLSIRGGSGTGKSTLLHILGLLDRPDTGSYKLDGIDTTLASTGQRGRLRSKHIGFVFQGFHLLPEFDVLENVLMPVRCAGGSLGMHRQRARDLLAAVGLPDKIHALPKTLSGGESQRVALCRALVAKPPLVLADEPTGNLDPATAAVVLQLLLDLAREHGSTVLIVTHDDGIAARAERRLTLHQGQLQEEEHPSTAQA